MRVHDSQAYRKMDVTQRLKTSGNGVCELISTKKKQKNKSNKQTKTKQTNKNAQTGNESSNLPPNFASEETATAIDYYIVQIRNFPVWYYGHFSGGKCAAAVLGYPVRSSTDL